MEPDRLKEIEDLFQAALEHPSAERREFLAEVCTDAALRAEIAALLDAHDEGSAYFEDLADRISAASPLEVEAAVQHQIRVGPYRTVRMLGSGGMGAVFLAERADGHFDQQVALKLIRLGMDSPDAVRRFLTERQIVARLDHPHIARLLDGGVTDEGRPYFVMEYVAGRPLTRYCDEERLPIARRLQLLVAVGEAVQYAHRNLIVHRDVKPGNILVTAGGQVKLLDFGIAKLLSDEVGAAGAGSTRTRERVLTPAYAAPEQIRGEPVTTATDVYALGAVLYELLGGRLPHDPADRSPADFDRIVLEDEPPRPSAVVDDGAAAARGTRRDRLQRLLRGDLDTICLKALRREPARRYQSVEQLVDDLRRHLAGRPVVAREDTLGYRAAKFIRRHRVTVAAAAAFAVLIVGFAVATAVQSARIARERDKARQVAALFVDMFEVADPSEARGAAVTAREVLDRGVTRIEGGLSGQPEVQAALFEVVGRVYQNLGLYARATPLVEKTLELRRKTLGPERPEVADGLSDLGELVRLKGEYRKAEPVLRDALALNRRVRGERHGSEAHILNNLAKVLYATGGYQEAETISRRALEISRASFGERHVEVAESLNNMAAVAFGRGDDGAAEPLFRQALAVRRAAVGNDHPLVAAALTNLASVLTRRGDYEPAEQAHREALVLYQRLLGREHPRVATALNNLALVLYAKKDYAEAEPLFRESLEMRRELLDARHADIAQSTSNLALLLQTTGRLEEADPLYREALDIRRRAFGEEHTLVAQTLNNLGLLLQAKGDRAGAEPLFRRALGMLRTLLGDAHPLVATNLHNLGALLRAKGDAAGAETAYRDALAIRRKALPAGHPEIAYTLVALGRLLDERGDSRAAEPLLREAVAIRRKVFPAGHPDVADAEQALARCLAARPPASKSPGRD